MKLTNRHFFLSIVALLLCSLTTIQAQNEKLEVAGGIKTDSILITNLPAFRAELTTDLDIGASANTTFVINSWKDVPTANQQTLFDKEDNFDAANGIFTAPRSGLYYLQVSWIFKSVFFGDDLILSYISVNGSTSENCINGHFTLTSVGNTQSYSTFARMTRTFGGMLKLDKGDEVAIQFSYNNISSVNGSVVDYFLEARSSFSGYLIADLD